MSTPRTLKEIEKIRVSTISWGLLLALATVATVALVRRVRAGQSS